MEIAILSDSHDQLSNLEKAVDFLNSKSIPEIIFCGDFCSPIPVKRHFARFNGKIHAVFGNTEDRATIMKLSLSEVKNLNIYGEFGEFSVQDTKIAITHYPEYGEALANTGKYNLVCNGHTHKEKQDTIGNTIFINPGEVAGFFGDAGFKIYNTNSKQITKILIKDL